LLNFLGVDTF